MATCPSCGESIEDGVRFCEHCGTGLELAQPAPEAPTVVLPAAPARWPCPACSLENEADDLFCPACGSARPSAAAAASGAAEDVTIAAAPDATTAAAPDAFVTAEMAAPYAPVAYAAASPTCPQCGAANDADAAFCYACGARLDAGPTAPPYAAVGGGPAPGGGQTAGPSASTSHAGRWIAVIAVLACIAVAAGLGFFWLRGRDSRDDRSAAGGATPTATPTPTDTSEGESEEGAGTEPQMTARDVTGYCESVQGPSLPPVGDNTYYADNLIDGDLTTCWSESAPGFGLGETVRFKFAERLVLTKLRIVPGYLKSKDGWNRWFTNGRLRRVTLTFSDGTQRSCRFADAQRWQTVDLGETMTSWVKMTIDAVYEPTPGTAHYARDTSVSEVELRGWPESEEAE